MDNQLDDSLTPEELARVDAFARQLDITDIQQMLIFGSGAQKKVATLSETVLAKIRELNSDEAGQLVSSAISELRAFGSENEKKGFFASLARRSETRTSPKERHDDIEAIADRATKALDRYQITLLKNAAVLDKLHELNSECCKELTMYLLAGRRCLANTREEKLSVLAARAQKSGSAKDIEAARSLSFACDRFEKKLFDLNLSRTVAMQMAPQIRLAQNTESLLAEKIRATLSSAIPLWKSQALLALDLAESRAKLAQAEEDIRRMDAKLQETAASLL
ncbi:MAG: toxic anion resistance protein [Eggerthellaceae bacterium]|nr:toxic anion resistance protein [Eggerthellaceae bacterium]